MYMITDSLTYSPKKPPPERSAGGRAAVLCRAPGGRGDANEWWPQSSATSAIALRWSRRSVLTAMLRATDPRSHGPGGLGEGHGDAVVVPEHPGGAGGG